MSVVAEGLSARPFPVITNMGPEQVATAPVGPDTMIRATMISNHRAVFLTYGRMR